MSAGESALRWIVRLTILLALVALSAVFFSAIMAGDAIFALIMPIIIALTIYAYLLFESVEGIGREKRRLEY